MPQEYAQREISEQPAQGLTPPEGKWPASSIEMRPIDSLKRYARNPRVHSREQIEKIASSIKHFGFTIPLLVDEGGTLICGHGRLAAALAIGLERVPVMTASGWSEEDKKAYVIADNKLADGGEWDESLLSFELGSLEDAGFDLSLTGFDDAPEAEEDAKGPKVKEVVVDTSDLEATFWVSLRGPLKDQARVLDAVKAALGEPGEVEIDVGVIA